MQIVIAGITYLRPTISEHTARPDAAIVFDPSLLDDTYGAGPEDPDRARKVADQVDVQIRTFEQATDCPKRAPCRLKVDALFRFGRPVVVGDTATVNVAIWWAGRPEWRDPTPVVIVELTLVRSDGQWIGTKKRTLMMSSIPILGRIACEQPVSGVSTGIQASSGESGPTTA